MSEFAVKIKKEVNLRNGCVCGYFNSIIIW